MRIGEVEAERASRAPVPDDLGEQLKQWWEPLMKRAPYLSDSIGAQVRFTIGDVGRSGARLPGERGASVRR